MTETKPKRRWFRFSLRTLFVLVTLLCIWLGYQVNWIYHRHKLIADFGESSLPWRYYLHSPDVPLSLRILGERRVIVIYAPTSMAELAHKLFPEAEVDTFPDAEIGLASRHLTINYLPPDHE